MVIKEIAASIKELKKKKKEIEDDLKLKRKIYAVIKKKLEEYRASGGKKGERGVAIMLHRRWKHGFNAFHAIDEHVCAMDLDAGDGGGSG